MKKQAVLLSLLLFVFIAGCETKTTGEVTRVVCDGWPDVSIEVRVVKDGNAFLYLKELKGPSKGNIPAEAGIPTGQQVTVQEEQFEPPKISLLPKVLVPDKFWWRLWGGFENFLKDKVDYWISNVKTKKSWLLPSAAFISLLFLFFVKSLSFYRQRKSLR